MKKQLTRLIMILYLNRRSDVFPSFLAVKGNVTLAANYWNETGSEFYFHYDPDSSEIEVSMKCGCEDWKFVEDENINAYTYFSVGMDCYFDWADIVVNGGGGRNNNNGECSTICPDYSASKSIMSKYNQNYNLKVRLFDVLTHEFGHALGLDHTNEDIELYEYIMMGRYSKVETLITEDDSHGPLTHYGVSERNIQLRTGFWTGDGNLYFYDKIILPYKTQAQPSIAGNPYASQGEYDFAIAWTDPITKKVKVGLLKQNSYTGITMIKGPIEIPDSQTLQGPSVAVGRNGRYLVAYRYEKENPTNFLDNSLIKIAIFPDYQSNTPSNIVTLKVCGDTNDKKCYTSNTPVLTYNKNKDRFVIAWVSADECVSSSGSQCYSWRRDKYEIKFSVSRYYTGWTWNSSQAFGLFTPNIPPAFSCLAPNDTNECLLFYVNYAESSSKISTIYKKAFSLSTNGYDGWLNPYYCNYAIGTEKSWWRIGLTGSSKRWIFTYLKNEDFSPLTYGVQDNTLLCASVSWYGNTYSSGMESLLGYSIAYHYRLGTYLFSWIDQ